MSEVFDAGIALRKGKLLPDESHGTDGVPNSDKFDVDVHREGFLECRGLSPALAGVIGVHIVREWDLLVITGWQKTDLLVKIRRNTMSTIGPNQPCESCQPMREQ